MIRCVRMQGCDTKCSTAIILGWLITVRLRQYYEYVELLWIWLRYCRMISEFLWLQFPDCECLELLRLWLRYCGMIQRNATAEYFSPGWSFTSDCFLLLGIGPAARIGMAATAVDFSTYGDCGSECHLLWIGYDLPTRLWFGSNWRRLYCRATVVDVCSYHVCTT